MEFVLIAAACGCCDGRVDGGCRVFRVVTGSRHDMEMRRPTSAYR